MKRAFASWPIERFVGLGILTAGLIFALLLAAIANLGLRSSAWPTTSGVITSSEVAWYRSDGKTRYAASLEYTYVLEGRPYRSSRRTYRSSEPTEAYARGVTARFPKGREVRVHYDPADPRRAVLEPGTDAIVLGALVTSGIVSLIGAGVLVGTVAPVATLLERRRHRAARRRIEARRSNRAARRS